MSAKDKTFMVTQDFTDDFNKVVRGLKTDAVLVGIPAAQAPRTSAQDSQGINNATLLAMNEFGSPARGIPARPVMSIGIKLAQPEITALFAETLKAVFQRGLPALSIYYNRIGNIAANSVKKTINAQIDIDPPSAATMRARQAKGFKGNKALIVTGQLRNAITYVVAGEED